MKYGKQNEMHIKTYNHMASIILVWCHHNIAIGPARFVMETFHY